MNEDKMLKEEILDVLAKQLNGGRMIRILSGGRIHGGAAGDILEFNIEMDENDDDNWEDTRVYFKEPKDKSKPPDKLYKDKQLKKRFDKDTEQ
jgi:hypothetical protein